MLKGWRTIIINSAIAVLGVLEAAEWVDILPEHWAGLVLIAVGILNNYLRTITNTKVGQTQ